MQSAEHKTKAMSLRPDERENLAFALLDSLASEPTEGIDETWLNEIDRRMDEVESGRAAMVPYDQFREAVRKKTGW